MEVVLIDYDHTFSLEKVMRLAVKKIPVALSISQFP